MFCFPLVFRTIDFFVKVYLKLQGVFISFYGLSQSNTYVRICLIHNGDVIKKVNSVLYMVHGK